MPPGKIQQLLQSAIAHHRAGRLPEAENLYRQLRAAAPKNFDVVHLSGTLALQQGRIPEAIELLSRAERLSPKSHICLLRLGHALLAARRAPEAEIKLRRAVELQPTFHEGWDGLALGYKLQDQLAEAAKCHEKAVTLKPDFACGWYNYGLTCCLRGQYPEALRCHERALAADPAYSLALFGRAQALHQLHRMPEAVAEYARFLERQPDHHEARSYRLYGLHDIEGITREQLFAEHLEFGRRVNRPVAPALPNTRDPHRRLRVAILSPDLRMHSCAYFLEPLLQHLDPAQFELYLYHDHFREDAFSARLRGLAAKWRNFVGAPGETVEKTIREDAPDILIDLAGHTGLSNRLPLYARRLAPVQVTYLGYPNTTGVAAMDYRFTDAVADPLGDADRFATEKLVRFSSTAWCYAPPAGAPEVQPLAWSLDPSRPVTLVCFNHPKKITDGTLKLWARVLGEIRNARLVLKGVGFSQAEHRAQYAARFARCGLPADRVDLRERTPDTESHLAQYQEADVALDTFAYNGTTTTCEALWMGVPVVTLRGEHHMSRVSASLLTAIGHSEWIASNADEYVRIVGDLVRDRGRLAGIRAELRDEMRRSPLLDHPGQAARFGAALRECWAAWCVETAAA